MLALADQDALAAASEAAASAAAAEAAAGAGVSAFFFGAEMAGMAARAAMTAAEAAIWRMDFILNILWLRGGETTVTASYALPENPATECATAAKLTKITLPLIIRPFAAKRRRRLGFSQKRIGFLFSLFSKDFSDIISRYAKCGHIAAQQAKIAAVFATIGRICGAVIPFHSLNWRFSPIRFLNEGRTV